MQACRKKMYVEGNYMIKWIHFSMILSLGSCQKHYFLRQPFNTTVRIGKTALLRCAIANKQTDVQWTVDDFALGLGFMDPRLSYFGSRSQGEYNLKIVGVKLSDDAIYRCQANADYGMGIPPLRSRGAHLTVIVPPKVISVEPESSGLIPVKYPGSVTVTCTIPDTKPAAVITWKVNGETYRGETKRQLIPKHGSKLVTTSSSIILQPSKQQNSSSVECAVNHEGLDAPITKTSSLNVLYPPNLPRISGSMDHPMKSGEELVLECVVNGGNPIAKITWFIGSEMIHGQYQQTQEGSLSVLRHILRPQDDRKQLTCRAETPALDLPLEDHVMLQVYYPPEHIVIDRYPENGARENGVMTFSCSYTRSNPRASLFWYIDGVKLPLHWKAESRFIPYVIASRAEKLFASGISLKLTSVSREDANLKITCRAQIPEINYSGEASTYPKVNYPARKADVTIFSLSSPITLSMSGNPAYKAGDIVLMRCEVLGGNPAPNPTWSLNGKQIRVDENTAISDPEVKVYTGDAVGGAIPGEFITTTTLEFTLESMHNNATVACMVDHEDYHDTVNGKKILEVAFPPASVSVKQFPSSIVAGKPMNLTCITSSSNPAARITWYKNDVRIPEHFSASLPHTDGSMGGFVAKSRLQMIPMIETDGSVITCRAEVAVLQQSVSQQHNLRVEYPPKFFPINGNRSSFNATEGDGFIDIEAIAHSNPPEIKFSIYRIRPRENYRGTLTLVKEALTKDRRFVWRENGGHLRINNLRQDDDGMYVIEATNSRGTTSMNITLNVFYPPKIIDITGPKQTLVEGGSTELQCHFVSHRLSKVKITWAKSAPGKGRAKYNVKNFRTHSVLYLDNVTAEDRGGYRCTVDNTIGNGDSAQTSIDMEYSPVFDNSSPNKVAASFIDDDGSLNPAVVVPCVVHARPTATLSWSLRNKTIVPTEQNGYSVTQQPIDRESIKSFLSVNNVKVDRGRNLRSDVLAEYLCVASNSQGETTKTVQIVLQGSPDVPFDLDVLNVSDSEAWITWREGFDGGDDQEFVVQYKVFKKNSAIGSFQEKNAESNHAAITNLEPSTEYLMRVLAKNQYGLSEPSEYIRIRTAETSFSENNKFGVNKAYIIVLSVISAIVLIFVIVISILTIRRCKITKQTYKPKSIETDSESLTRVKSSLSSYGPEEKRINEDKQGDETRRLTDDIELGTDDKLDRETCYLDCSMSHCSSRHSAEHGQEGECISGTTCPFPTFRDDNLTTSATQSRITRSAFSSQSARFQRPFADDYSISRNCREPSFRQDVPPSDDCLFNVDNNYYEKPLDLPLPPTLPLYKYRTYAEQSHVGPSADFVSNSRHAHYRGSFRKCNTLEPSRFTFKPDCMDYCTAPIESRTSFLNDDHSQVYLNKSAETCLYNVVSTPEEKCGYASSLISMPGNASEKYYAGINERHVDTGSIRDSQSSSSSTSNSGLFLKSLDKTRNESKKRASIVNDDGSINTFGLDYPISFSATNVLDAISESIQNSPSNSSSACQLYDATPSSSNVPGTDLHDRGLKQTVRFCSKRDVDDENSDNDTDSGCGGSSDVAMRSPTSPEQYSEFSPFSGERKQLVLRL